MDSPHAELAAALDAARAQGLPATDPVGWQVVEALARRAAALPPAAQAHTERRLHERLARLAHRAAQRQAAWQAAGGGAAEPAVRPGLESLHALQALVAGLAPRPPANAVAGAAPGAPPELKALRDFRRSWSRLQAEQWLDQSVASAPDNAGPLNSHGLAVRTLQRLNALSPAYLERLLVLADALRWLEPSLEGLPEAARSAPREAARAPTRSAARPGPRSRPARR